MGYIVSDAVQRLRTQYGTFHADQWREFLDACGLTWHMLDLPEKVDALIIHDTIILNRNRDPQTRAQLAFHEAGHYWLHAGNLETFWRTRPQGEVTVARFERQARDFAQQFPIWED